MTGFSLPELHCPEFVGRQESGLSVTKPQLLGSWFGVNGAGQGRRNLPPVRRAPRGAGLVGECHAQDRRHRGTADTGARSVGLVCTAHVQAPKPMLGKGVAAEPGAGQGRADRTAAGGRPAALNPAGCGTAAHAGPCSPTCRYGPSPLRQERRHADGQWAHAKGSPSPPSGRRKLKA